jgi:hypothetical protein
MSYPTMLGPWFVVQRLAYGPSTYEDNVLVGVEYYQHSDEGDELWTADKKQACLFMSLQSAARVAEGTIAEVRVLTSKEHAEEFGRG